MGAVYKARQPGLDRLVALKILPPEIGHDASFAERFTREARALARLSHNHIVSVYDFGQVNDLFYIVMEYVDGANLRQTIQAGGLTSQAALAIVPQICEALQFAHDEGIVHRDIKPENILIDKRGRVKIADFGLAKLLRQDADEHSLTGTHQVMGTLRYMAPEQMQGSREVDHRADIYSLGVVFYELLTGELPMGKFAPPSKRVHVDVRLDEIVLRALEQEPAKRYQHASEVKTDVESVTNDPQVLPFSPVTTPNPSPSSEPPADSEISDPWEFLKSEESRTWRNRLVVMGVMILVAPFVATAARVLWPSTGMVLLLGSLCVLAAISTLVCLLILGGAGVSIILEWRNNGMPLAWKMIRSVFWLVYAICFVGFFGASFYGAEGSNPGSGMSFTIGTPFPWFSSGTGEPSHIYIIFSSWAWAILSIGCLCLYALDKSQNVRNVTAGDSKAIRPEGCDEI